jgi:hypothetical protein
MLDPDARRAAEAEQGIGQRHGPLAESQAEAGSALGSIVTLPVTLVGAPIRIIAGE